MNRKSFLKNTAAIAPFIVAYNPLIAARSNFFQNLMLGANNKNKILILIQLNGGNDSLNTIIPIDKYNILSKARRDILIPENRVLKLNDTNVFGLHPSLTGLQSLYNDKVVSFVQGVGYPNPEYSHFRGINIKYTGTTGKEESRSGWIGRYLETRYPNYPNNYPQKPDDGPPAVRIGVVSPKLAEGNGQNFGVGAINITEFDTLSGGGAKDPISNNLGGMSVEALRAISRQIELYAPILKTFALRQETLSKLYPEPEKNSLADQLKIVAKLIGSGLNTPIYMVQQTGYDHHADQVDKNDPTTGRHANLLKCLSEAITAFQDDITLMGKQDDVVGMTFSEFGRRIASSDSYGTDHGAAETVILFGSKVRNGIIGTSPVLPPKVTFNDNLPVQFDFRSLYASLLKEWFDVSEDALKKTLPQAPPDRLNLFKV